MTQTQLPEVESPSVALTPQENGEQVSSLVALAIERGVDVAVLERLVALQERVTERNARASFFQALANFQEFCPEIPKSSKAEIATSSGARYSYTYAPLEAITRAIRPVLKNNNLSYSWDVEPGEAGTLTVICVVRHIDGHEERARFPVPIETSAKMSGAQKNGAALTYGRRQSLIAVLGLTAADADADAPNPEDVAKVSDSQAADLAALCDDVGAKRDKFLTFMGAGSFADIPAAQYSHAVRALESKRKGAK